MYLETINDCGENEGLHNNDFLKRTYTMFCFYIIYMYSISELLLYANIDNVPVVLIYCIQPVYTTTD